MNRKLQNVLPQNVFVDSLDDMLQRINGEIEGRCLTCGSEMKYTPGLRMCPSCNKLGVPSILELRRQPSTKWEKNNTFHKQESRQKTRPKRRRFSSREQDAWDIIIHPKRNVLLFSTQHLYETPHQQTPDHRDSYIHNNILWIPFELLLSEASRNEASDIARLLYLTAASTGQDSLVASLQENQQQTTKSEFTVAEALGLTLHANLSFAQYNKTSVYSSTVDDVATLSTKKREFPVRPFPSLEKVMSEYKAATSEMEHVKNDIDNGHCSLGLRSLLNQMINVYRYQKVLNFKRLRREGLLLRWGFDGTPTCSKGFMIVSSLAFVGLRRMVLSRDQHRYAILTKTDGEALESFKKHFDAQIRKEIEDLRENGLTLPEGKFKVRIAYCVDLSASAKATGLRNCHKCPFCNQPKNGLGNFDANYEELMRDLSNEDHALPRGTNVLDIVPDVLHMKIRLVINLLVAYVNEIVLLCHQGLTEQMWRLLQNIGVAVCSQQEGKKQLRFKLNGPQANKVLKAFCAANSPLLKLLIESIPRTSSFESAARRNRELSGEELQRMWVNHQQQLFERYSALWLRLGTLMTFLEKSGLRVDLLGDEIDWFQRAARDWGELWKSVCPSRMPLYVHVLVCHVKGYLKEYRQLGLFSQQPSESKYKKLKEDYVDITNHHADWLIQIFKREWAKWEVLYGPNERYVDAKRLMKSSKRRKLEAYNPNYNRDDPFAYLKEVSTEQSGSNGDAPNAVVESSLDAQATDRSCMEEIENTPQTTDATDRIEHSENSCEEEIESTPQTTDDIESTSTDSHVATSRRRKRRQLPCSHPSVSLLRDLTQRKQQLVAQRVGIKLKSKERTVTVVRQKLLEVPLDVLKKAVDDLKREEWRAPKKRKPQTRVVFFVGEQLDHRMTPTTFQRLSIDPVESSDIAWDQPQSSQTAPTVERSDIALEQTQWSQTSPAVESSWSQSSQLSIESTDEALLSWCSQTDDVYE